MNEFKQTSKSFTHPRIGVGVIIIRDDFVLMGKRKNSHGDGTWSFPGGHLELNEEIGACAKREVKEETGLLINKMEYGPYTNDIFVNEKKHYVTLFVMAHSEKGKPVVKEPHACSEWRWVKWHQLPSPLFLPVVHLQEIGFSPFRWSTFDLTK
jgi:8-oxo-dGTP diphosphatase